jgi:phosphocarrier protein
MSDNSNNHEPIRAVKDVTILNKLGIHARPASKFVRIASRYHSEILVEKEGDTVNGKSIMGLMMLAAGPGSRITLRAEGDDANQALTELEDLVNRKFEED